MYNTQDHGWAVDASETPQAAFNGASDYATDLAGDLGTLNPWGDTASEAIKRWSEFADDERLYRAAWLRHAAGWLSNLADTLEGK